MTIHFGLRDLTKRNRSIYNRRTGGEPASKIRAERMAHERGLAAMNIKGAEDVSTRKNLSELAQTKLAVSGKENVANISAAGSRHVAGLRGASDMAQANLLAGVRDRETSLRFGPGGIERTKLDKGFYSSRGDELTRKREDDRITKQLDAWEHPFKRWEQPGLDYENRQSEFDVPEKVRQIRLNTEALPQGEREAYYKRAIRKYREDMGDFSGISDEELYAMKKRLQNKKRGPSWGHYVNPMAGAITD